MFARSRFGILSSLFGVLIALSAVLRTALLIRSWHGIDLSLPILADVYGVGVFYDCVTFFYAAVPFALYLFLIPDKIYHNPGHKVLAYAVSFIVTYVLLFDAVAEYFFFEEFGARFNFIVVDYLVYTREVIGNIVESYHLPLILSVLFVINCFILFYLRNSINLSLASASTLRQRMKAGVIFAAAPILAFAFVNQPMTNISGNTYANEIAGNGIYSLFAAFRNSELDYQRFYPTENDAAVLKRLRNLIRERNNHFHSIDAHDTRRRISARGPENKWNVIVIVEESLSTEFLGVFGNPPGLTPHLDKLARESLLFTHLYATGTRTVRGLEAITLSVPPLPGSAVVKRPGNEGFFSWGALMRSRGYDTKFIYAGYGYFDNMNYFFVKNGFDVVDRNSFSKEEITFSNIWGVCDEDLFGRVIKEAGKSHASGRPFFSIVMTTSNHRPFTYPAGKIDIPSGAGRAGAVKYADYAVGRFIEQAKKQPWYADTVFVILADHCAGSAGKSELPVKRYEIPLLIYAPSHIKARRVDTMASQIDVAPTVLGLLHFSYTTAFLGRDVLAAKSGILRAFISTYQKLGFIEGDTLVILSPQKRVQAFHFERKDGCVTEIPPPGEIVNDALAYYQGTNFVYANRLNRIP